MLIGLQRNQQREMCYFLTYFWAECVNTCICMLLLQSNCVEQLLDSSKVKITSGETNSITEMILGKAGSFQICI